MCKQRLLLTAASFLKQFCEVVWPHDSLNLPLSQRHIQASLVINWLDDHTKYNTESMFDLLKSHLVHSQGVAYN